MKAEAEVRASGFTLIELLVLGFLLLVCACILIPSIAHHRQKALAQHCGDNLKQVGLAFRIWPGPGDGSYPPRTDAAVGGTKELASSGQVFVHFRVMSNELGSASILVCPADSAKTPATNFASGFSDSNVSYFVSLDAQDTYPQMFLSGDRNLALGGSPLTNGLFSLTTNMPLSWTKAIHQSCGNILLADGSVQFFDSRRLTEATRNQGWDTNRLVIP